MGKDDLGCRTCETRMFCTLEMLGINVGNDMGTKPKRPCTYRLTGSVVRLIQMEMKASGMDATAVVNRCIIQTLGGTEEGKKIILEEALDDPVRNAELKALGLADKKK